MAFSTFLSWRGEVGLRVGGRLLEHGVGGKGPVKQREVVCWQGRQETQISQDSPPSLLLDYRAGPHQIEADSLCEPLQHYVICPSFPFFKGRDLSFSLFFSSILVQT